MNTTFVAVAEMPKASAACQNLSFDHIFLDICKKITLLKIVSLTIIRKITKVFSYSFSLLVVLDHLELLHADVVLVEQVFALVLHQVQVPRLHVGHQILFGRLLQAESASPNSCHIVLLCV